jgi:hypothetical protein
LTSAVLATAALFPRPANGNIDMNRIVAGELGTWDSDVFGATAELFAIWWPWYVHTIRGDFAFWGPSGRFEFGGDAEPFSIGPAIINFPDLQPTGSLLPLAKVAQRDSDILVDSLTGYLFSVQNATYPVIWPETPNYVPGNTAPIASNVTINYAGGEKLVIPVASLVSDPDGDALTSKAISKSHWGVLVQQSEQITYVPFGMYSAGDSFTIEFSDGKGGVAQSTVILVNPFADLTGSFSGTLGENGRLSATINRQGKGVIQLQFKDKEYSGFVEFPESGTAYGSLSSNDGSELNVRLDFVSSTGPALHVEFSDGNTPVSFDAPKIVAGGFVIDNIGQYNFALVNWNGTKSHGYTTVRVSPEGNVRATGVLANGRTWTAGTTLRADGKVYLEVLNKKRKLILSGLLTLPPSHFSTSMSGFYSSRTIYAGKLSWERPSRSVEMAAVGSLYRPGPFRGQNMFGATETAINLDIVSPLLTYGQALSYLGGQGFVYGNTIGFNVGSSNRAMPLRSNSAVSKLKLKPDGRFNGNYQELGRTTTVPFRGIFYSRDDGFGHTSSGPGSVTIERSRTEE